MSGQVQYSLLDRRPENGMADFCAQHGIALLPYGTTAGGLLSSRYLGLRASRRGWVCALCQSSGFRVYGLVLAVRTSPCRGCSLVLEASSAAATWISLQATSASAAAESPTHKCVSRVRMDTYSLSKYSSVVQEVGGWDWLQRLLGVLDAVAQRRGASIANVAQRWVLDRPQARSSLKRVRV